MSDWPTVTVGQYVKQRSEKVVIESGQDYVTMGVRWYGKGAYLRPASRPKTKALALARKGDFIFCRIDAQNGPFGVVPADLDGALVTNEFPLYTVDSSDLDAHFLALCFANQSSLKRINKLRDGRDGRARWKEADFEAWTIPLPPLPVQRRIVEVIAAADRYIDALELEESTLTTLLATTRQHLLSGCPRVPLASVCEITARLVNPKDDEYADLLHIGVDVIEKGTGRLVNPRTAREDGVISGKYLVGESDVVYSKIRPRLRKAAFPGFVALCSADAYPLSPLNGTPPALLREILLEDTFTSQTVALSTRLKMPKVNRNELFSTTVAMPQTEGERTRVATALDAIRGQIDAVSAEQARARSARAALLDALLDQKIEVLRPTGDGGNLDLLEPLV
ncbi:type I restriction enzyme S subunit [Microbacterium natoriense]|uniref:Type I restriction enzyme S subunit n=1 Tax=Microbacterium natoriense TaxID=284570 RepID=A0AAW8EYQ5_9MICO|nr:restriction endonuclease subunit S [Microbacterium natoriense]MDQ0648658.1 type I restriction enzyme S subunit [Microbacterium natoriense]